MSISPYFYHKTIRRMVVAFATLFNGYQVQKPDGTYIDVPISWSSKQQWYIQAKQSAEKENIQSITLPRMGFTIPSLSYDFDRKVSSLNKIANRNPATPDELFMTYEPVPYNLDFDLFIVTKTVEEGLQLIEQIIPFFTPSFNLTLLEIDDVEVTRDIPIKLNSITPDLKIESSFDGVDVKLWDLSFTAEINLYKDIKSRGIIKTVVVDMYPMSDVETDAYKDRYKAWVNPETAYIDDEYEILESLGLVATDEPKLP